MKSKLTQQENEFWIAPIMAEQLDRVKKRVLKRDMDFNLVVDGEEGVGKSVLAMQLCKYLDPEFNIDQIAFNSDQFLKLIKDPEIKKGNAILLDETFSAASSRASLSDVNKAMIGVATEMRQRNLFVVYCIPSFFDLDRYFALWRTKALVHVYFDDQYNRRYVLFPKDHKKYLYLYGKKTYNYKKPKAPFPPFQFSNQYVVDENEYRLRKRNAFVKREISARGLIVLRQRNAYIQYIYDKMGLSLKEIGKIPELYNVKGLMRNSVSDLMKSLVTQQINEEKLTIPTYTKRKAVRKHD